MSDGAEVWQEIPDWPEYEASTRGRVRRATDSPSGNFKAGYVIGPSSTANGYAQYALYRDGQAHYRYGHRLVARAFHGEPPRDCEVNHLNGDKMDNRPENIEWCTKSENQSHAIQSGLRPVGEESHMAKLTESDVREIRSRYESEEITQVALARDYGVTKSNVSCIVNRKSWRHV